PSFSTLVLSGEKSALPYGIPGDRKFEKGDFLLIDFGVITKNGNCSDMTRTFVLCEATKKQKEIYNILREANQAGIDEVKANDPIKKIDINTRNYIDDNMYCYFLYIRMCH